MNKRNGKIYKSGIKHMRKNKVELYSMCIIPVLLLFVFCYIPMFGVVIAFKDYRFDLGIFGSKWVGFKNFEFLFQSQDFVRIVRNTLGLNALFIVLGLIFAVTFALLMFELRSRRAVKVYQTVYMIPNYLSWVIVGYMSYALLNPKYGFVNQILRIFGSDGVDWYSQPMYWPAILATASVWKSLGVNTIIYYASLMGMNEEYVEAAKIDGATKLQCTWHIVLPHLFPLMTIMTILSIGNIFRADFGLFYQLTRDIGALYPTTDVLDTYIYRVMKTIGDLSMSSAVGLLQSTVGFVLIVLTNYIVNKIDPERALF